MPLKIHALLDTLREKRIRYVIVDESRRLPADTTLREIARGQGIGIYEAR